MKRSDRASSKGESVPRVCLRKRNIRRKLRKTHKLAADENKERTAPQMMQSAQEIERHSITKTDPKQQQTSVPSRMLESVGCRDLNSFASIFYCALRRDSFVSIRSICFAASDMISDSTPKASLPRMFRPWECESNRNTVKNLETLQTGNHFVGKSNEDLSGNESLGKSSHETKSPTELRLLSASQSEIDAVSSEGSRLFSEPFKLRKNWKQRKRLSSKLLKQERRIVANARERSRVQAISEAYETLRRAVPFPCHYQKIPKLLVLKTACAYIELLFKLAAV